MERRSDDHEARPVYPLGKRNRTITLAAALLVLIGGLLAVAAWQRGQSALAPQEIPHAPEPAGPLAGLTILVDPGHGGYDGGARCRDSGLWEKELNLQVALKLEASLQQRGAQVIMTRRTDTDLCSEPRPATLTKKRQDMLARVAMATEGSADLLLSVHMNEYRSRAESGPQVFYRAGSDDSRLLAGCLQEALIAALQPPKARTAMAGDYFILQLEIPSALVECGFISNAAEERRLLDPAYQEQLAGAIAEGVCEYVRIGGSDGK